MDRGDVDDSFDSVPSFKDCSFSFPGLALPFTVDGYKDAKISS